MRFVVSDEHFVWVVRFLIDFTAHYGIEPTNGRTRLELNLIVKKLLDIFHLLLFRSSCLLFGCFDKFPSLPKNAVGNYFNYSKSF